MRRPAVCTVALVITLVTGGCGAVEIVPMQGDDAETTEEPTTEETTSGEPTSPASDQSGEERDGSSPDGNDEQVEADDDEARGDDAAITTSVELPIGSFEFFVPAWPDIRDDAALASALPVVFVRHLAGGDVSVQAHDDCSVGRSEVMIKDIPALQVRAGDVAYGIQGPPGATCTVTATQAATDEFRPAPAVAKDLILPQRRSRVPVDPDGGDGGGDGGTEGSGEGTTDGGDGGSDEREDTVVETAESVPGA